MKCEMGHPSRRFRLAAVGTSMVVTFGPFTNDLLLQCLDFRRASGPESLDAVIEVLPYDRPAHYEARVSHAPGMLTSTRTPDDAPTPWTSG